MLFKYKERFVPTKGRCGVMLMQSPALLTPDQLVAATMISLVEKFLPWLDPQDQPLIIEIYGYMPERHMCAALRADQSAYALVETYFRKRGISFQCRYVEYFVGVIFQLEESLQYEVSLSTI